MPKQYAMRLETPDKNVLPKYNQSESEVRKIIDEEMQFQAIQTL